MPIVPEPRHPLMREYLFTKRTRWQSDATRTIAVSCLNRWTDWLEAHHTEPDDATAHQCQAYINERVDAVAGSTAHKDWQHLGWFYDWLARFEDRPDPMRHVDAPRVGEPHPDRVRAVAEADYAKLLRSFDVRTEAGARDAAIVSLLYRSGPRRSEVSRMDRARWNRDAQTIQVKGKGNLWRTFGVADETALLIERYLRKRGHDDCPALFKVSKWGNASNPDGRLAAQGISQILERACDRLELTGISAHQFRRASTINDKRNGMSDSDICRQKGWRADNGVRMIGRYTKSDAETIAIEAFHATDPTAHRARRLKAVGS